MRRRRANLSVGVVVTVAVLAGYLVTACRIAQPVVESNASYFLEIVNDSADGVRVEIGLSGHDFPDAPAEHRDRSWSGIIALERGERRTFEMSSGLGTVDTPEDGIQLAQDFRRIDFYDADSDTPYRSYSYRWCGYYSGDQSSCASGDDAMFLYESPDGTLERLFVKSPERPFYLEVDKADPDVGRLVITFVPNADVSSADAVENSSR